MIEVLFGDSESGAMKAAKNYQKPDLKNSGISWIGEKPNKKELKKIFDKMSDGKAVGGNSQEVVCLPFLLDIGDINMPIESDYRKNLILDMYRIDEADRKNAIRELEERERYIKEIERLKNYASAGEDIRIWYSNAPYSMCGFYYVCNLLEEYNGRTSVIQLPEYIQSEDEIRFYVSWGEIDAGKFYQFLPLEKELSSEEIHFFSSNWSRLKEENSLLRAVINGKVIGVPEDFYDHIIRKEITGDEFVMAQLIGKIMSKYPLGIGDGWYVKRMNRMIEQGELVVVENHKEVYSQVLKKA